MAATRQSARNPSLLSGIARGLALFFGGFALLNLLGEVRYPGFDANIWWIDFRPLPVRPARVFLLIASILLLVWAVRPRMSILRRVATIVAVGGLVIVTARNAGRFYVLLAGGRIDVGVPVPFSLLVCLALALVLLGLAVRPRAPSEGRGSPAAVLTLGICLAGFPLLQMVCYGRTDYRRPADAIVVLGARAYPDGRASLALADRTRTGSRLYLDGLAPTIIFSGGPVSDTLSETDVMRRIALEMGVPDEAMVLDPSGVNTRATVRNTSVMFDRTGVERVLVVSHAYHLPRVKMAYAREGRGVYTVPADESRPLRRLPYYMAREVAALWLYYLRPLIPERR